MLLYLRFQNSVVTKRDRELLKILFPLFINFLSMPKVILTPFQIIRCSDFSRYIVVTGFGWGRGGGVGAGEGDAAARAVGQRVQGEGEGSRKRERALFFFGLKQTST
jgi:hypothetical protein